MTEPERNASEAGFTDSFEGKTSKNPYAPASKEAAAWTEGVKAAERAKAWESAGQWWDKGPRLNAGKPEHEMSRKEYDRLVKKEELLAGKQAPQKARGMGR